MVFWPDFWTINSDQPKFPWNSRGNPILNHHFGEIGRVRSLANLTNKYHQIWAIYYKSLTWIKASFKSPPPAAPRRVDSCLWDGRPWTEPFWVGPKYLLGWRIPLPNPHDLFGTEFLLPMSSQILSMAPWQASNGVWKGWLISWRGEVANRSLKKTHIIYIYICIVTVGNKHVPVFGTICIYIYMI